MNHALTELTADLAALGILFLVLLIATYGFAIGHIFSRFNKTERAILHRALQSHPRSQDPLMAKKEERLLKALDPE